jgi:hypothetical protein
MSQQKYNPEIPRGSGKGVVPPPPFFYPKTTFFDRKRQIPDQKKTEQNPTKSNKHPINIQYTSNKH